MSNLDRLVWAAKVVGRSHGVRVGIRLSDPSALELVRARLPPTWKDSKDEVVDRVYSLVVGGPDPKNASIKRYHVVYSDFTRLERQLVLEPVLDAMESDLALFVAEKARRHVFVHAGVVGWKGKAILIPGKTFSGKSTLVAALVKAGATYYSDEYAVLDARGRVHPYPRDLSLRDERANQSRVPPSAFGAEVGTRPLPVSLVVSSTYERGARWRPRPLTPGQAALELLANTIPAREKPRAVLSALAKVAERARAIRGKRGEAAPLVAELLAQAEAAPAAL